MNGPAFRSMFSSILLMVAIAHMVGCAQKREEPGCDVAVKIVSSHCSDCPWLKTQIPGTIVCAELREAAETIEVWVSVRAQLSGGKTAGQRLSSSSWQRLKSDTQAMTSALRRDCVACIDAPPKDQAQAEFCPTCFARPFNGSYSSEFPGGKRREQGTYREGKKHGPWKTWFENGRLMKDEGFADGRPDGRSLTRNEAGQMLSETNHRKGVLHGGRKRFKAGRIFEHAIFERGVPTGRWLSWHPNGLLKSQKDYETQCDKEKCTSRLHGYLMEWDAEGKPTRLEKHVHGQLEQR